MLAELGTLVGVPVVRALGGWIENAFEDGKVSRLEARQLGSTIFRIGFIGAGLFFGLDAFGLDVTAFEASASAVVLDFLFGAIKKK